MASDTVTEGVSIGGNTTAAVVDSIEHGAIVVDVVLVSMIRVVLLELLLA